MFGTKSKKEIATHNTIAAVTSKMDALQSTIEQETHADVAMMADMTEPLMNVIGKGTVIEGNVTAEGDLVVEGVVKGDVTTKTKLVVGPAAVIEGNLLSQHAEIAGRVQGTVKALGLLVINSTGTIVGDVITKDLNVESGSTFNGRLQVGGNVSTTPIEIPKLKLTNVMAPVAMPVMDSAFDAPCKKAGGIMIDKPVAMAIKPDKSDADKTAEQLAANLSKSVLLH